MYLRSNPHLSLDAISQMILDRIQLVVSEWSAPILVRACLHLQGASSSAPVIARYRFPFTPQGYRGSAPCLCGLGVINGTCEVRPLVHDWIPPETRASWCSAGPASALSA